VSRTKPALRCSHRSVDVVAFGEEFAPQRAKDAVPNPDVRTAMAGQGREAAQEILDPRDLPCLALERLWAEQCPF